MKRKLALLAFLLTLIAMIILYQEPTNTIGRPQIGEDVARSGSISVVGEEHVALMAKYANEYGKAQKSMSFEDWQQTFSKFYQSEEQLIYRKSVFLNTQRQISMHNRQYEQGKTTYFKALNPYSDLTPEQFIQKYTWGTPHALTATSKCTGSIMDTPHPPAQKDWAGKVNQMRKQDQKCGMDWALVAAATVEALYDLRIGQLPTLSYQQLLQCSGDYGNEGCSGGFMDQAFWYIIDNGIATSKSYQNRSVAACKYVPNMRFTGFSLCARVPSGNYSKLMSAIVQQPVSVALDMSKQMKDYDGGVFNGRCGSILNKGMMLTGYGGKAGGLYWILQNTLGKSWGINGHIHLARDEKDGPGKCGIQLWASLPQNIN